MSGNAWKIGFIVLATLALAVSVYFTLQGGAPEQADSKMYVDMRNGTLYRVPLKGHSLTVPMRSPEDMRMQTLFPVEQEDGKYFLVERYYEPEGIEGVNYDLLVGGTLEIRVAEGGVRKLDIDDYLEALRSLN